MPILAFADTIGVFCDTSVEPIEFAAGDVKRALESKNFTVEVLDIDQLNAAYPNKKVVIAVAADMRVLKILSALGGTAPTGLGEQAYALQTTTRGQSSFWVTGGRYRTIEATI